MSAPFLEMSAIVAVILGFMFLLSLGYIVLQLCLYNMQMDVQSPPYDTRKYADAVNKLCKFDVYAPFLFPLIFLSIGQFIGVLLTIPVLVVNSMRIYKKEVQRHANVIYQVVQTDSFVTLFKVIVMFLVWVYTLIKFILTLVL